MDSTGGIMLVTYSEYTFLSFSIRLYELNQLNTMHVLGIRS